MVLYVNIKHDDRHMLTKKITDRFRETLREIASGMYRN